MGDTPEAQNFRELLAKKVYANDLPPDNKSRLYSNDLAVLMVHTVGSFKKAKGSEKYELMELYEKLCQIAVIENNSVISAKRGDRISEFERYGSEIKKFFERKPSRYEIMDVPFMGVIENWPPEFPRSKNRHKGLSPMPKIEY